MDMVPMISVNLSEDNSCLTINSKDVRASDYLTKARKFAVKSHQAVNQKYGDEDYSVHLEKVANVALRVLASDGYIYHRYIDIHECYEILAACWGHDLIEDTNNTYNDVREYLGYLATEIVYALTNEKGRNRAERANSKYYEGIRNTRFATFVKLCDRIANVEYSLEKNSKMFGVYKKEYSKFKKNLKPTTFTVFYYRIFNNRKYKEEILVNEPMWKFLDSLLND